MRAWPVVTVTPRPDPHSTENMDAFLSKYTPETYSNSAEMKERAEEGDPKAQLALAANYESGNSVARDYAEALKWTRKAADQNDAWAQYDMARFYSEGRGVEKNEAESLSWLLKAAYNGLMYAQVEVAQDYYQGIGVEPNIVEAYAWLNVAAVRRAKSKRLPEFAARQRDGMEKQMRITEITAAQKRARELAALLGLTHAGSSLP